MILTFYNYLSVNWITENCKKPTHIAGIDPAVGYAS
jgi:hypothetical protein